MGIALRARLKSTAGFFPPAMGSGASSKKQFLFQHYRRISVVSCGNRFIDGFITYTYNYNMEVS